MRERLLFIIGLLSAGSVFAVEGVGSSGGGKGVLCGTHLRTLDLYEAEEVHGLKLDTSIPTVDGNIAAFGPELMAYLIDQPLPPINDAFRQGVAQEYRRMVEEKFKDTQNGEPLPLTNDATLPPLNAGCKEVQIAIYNDKTDTIQRDPLLWAMLDAQNQAALIIHEVIYKLARDVNVKTSDEVREIIGQFFSRNFLEPIFQPIFDLPAGKSPLVCLAGNSNQDASEVYESFAVETVKNGVSGVQILFRILRSTLIMNRTSGFIPGLTLDQLENTQFESKSFVVVDERTGKRLHITINGNLPDYFGGKTFTMSVSGGKTDGEIYGFCSPYTVQSPVISK